jgi:hypothetical protein
MNGRAPRTPSTFDLSSLVAAHGLFSRNALALDQVTALVDGEIALDAYGSSLEGGAHLILTAEQVPQAFAALCWAARELPDFGLTIVELLARVTVR